MSVPSPKKVGDLEYVIERDSSRGMKVPVTIFANAKNGN